MSDSSVFPRTRKGDAWPAEAVAMRPAAGSGALATSDSGLRRDVGLERIALRNSDALVLWEAAVNATSAARATGDVTLAEGALSQLRRSLHGMSETISRLRDPLWDVHKRLTLQDEPLRLGAVIAEAVREWALSLGGSDHFEVRLDLPSTELHILGDRRQLTVLIVTLCEILSSGGTECEGVQVNCRPDSLNKVAIELAILRTREQSANAIRLSTQTVILAASRCRLIAQMHGGDLEIITPDTAVISVATIDETPGLARRDDEAPRLTVRPDAHIVERDGRRIRLSWTEWQLFAFLWDNAGVIFSRAELATGAWGAQYANRRGEVEIYISRVRRKVEHDARHPRVIQTLRGLGYRANRT